MHGNIFCKAASDGKLIEMTDNTDTNADADAAPTGVFEIIFSNGAKARVEGTLTSTRNGYVFKRPQQHGGDEQLAFVAGLHQIPADKVVCVVRIDKPGLADEG